MYKLIKIKIKLHQGSKHNLHRVDKLILFLKVQWNPTFMLNNLK
jgi:hypothetical protein